MSVEYKSTYKCDFCGKEIDVDNIKIFQATKLYKDGLSTVNGIIPKNQKVLGL